MPGLIGIPYTFAVNCLLLPSCHAFTPFWIQQRPSPGIHTGSSGGGKNNTTAFFGGLTWSSIAFQVTCRRSHYHTLALGAQSTETAQRSLQSLTLDTASFSLLSYKCKVGSLLEVLVLNRPTLGIGDFDIEHLLGRSQAATRC